MINLKPSKPEKKEKEMMDQMLKEKIPFAFGNMKIGKEEFGNVIIADRKAISFKSFTPTARMHILNHKLEPQLWHPQEVGPWRDLALSRRLKLHR